jgi:hypothetical protein
MAQSVAVRTTGRDERAGNELPEDGRVVVDRMDDSLLLGL